MSKSINKILEERNILTESQNRFRKKRGTRDNIFILNSLIENRLKNKRGKLCLIPRHKSVVRQGQ